MKAPSSIMITEYARDCAVSGSATQRPNHCVAVPTHCSKTSAVAPRNTSLLLATSRATAPIGHASA